MEVSLWTNGIDSSPKLKREWLLNTKFYDTHFVFSTLIQINFLVAAFFHFCLCYASFIDSWLMQKPHFPVSKAWLLWMLTLYKALKSAHRRLHPVSIPSQILFLVWFHLPHLFWSLQIFFKLFRCHSFSMSQYLR